MNEGIRLLYQSSIPVARVRTKGHYGPEETKRYYEDDDEDNDVKNGKGS